MYGAAANDTPIDFMRTLVHPLLAIGGGTVLCACALLALFGRRASASRRPGRRSLELHIDRSRWQTATGSSLEHGGPLGSLSPFKRTRLASMVEQHTAGGGSLEAPVRGAAACRRCVLAAQREAQEASEQRSASAQLRWAQKDRCRALAPLLLRRGTLSSERSEALERARRVQGIRSALDFQKHESLHTRQHRGRLQPVEWDDAVGVSAAEAPAAALVPAQAEAGHTEQLASHVECRRGGCCAFSTSYLKSRLASLEREANASTAASAQAAAAPSISRRLRRGSSAQEVQEMIDEERTNNTNKEKAPRQFSPQRRRCCAQAAAAPQAHAARRNVPLRRGSSAQEEQEVIDEECDNSCANKEKAARQFRMRGGHGGLERGCGMSLHPAAQPARLARARQQEEADGAVRGWSCAWSAHRFGPPCQSNDHQLGRSLRTSKGLSIPSSDHHRDNTSAPVATSVPIADGDPCTVGLRSGGALPPPLPGGPECKCILPPPMLPGEPGTPPELPGARLERFVAAPPLPGEQDAQQGPRLSRVPSRASLLLAAIAHRRNARRSSDRRSASSASFGSDHDDSEDCGVHSQGSSGHGLLQRRRPTTFLAAGAGGIMSSYGEGQLFDAQPLADPEMLRVSNLDSASSRSSSASDVQASALFAGGRPGLLKEMSEVGTPVGFASCKSMSAALGSSKEELSPMRTCRSTPEGTRVATSGLRTEVV